jgi:ABC-2 type transport system ATP-binding protein
MITVEKLTKRFGNTTAVDEINAHISEGEIYGFLGPNGAGKTTTMRMLAGLTQPTSGSAKVAGTSISDRATLVKKIGYAPDTPPLYEQLTGWEQIRLAADIHGVDESGEKTEQYLDRFDMLEDADSRISSYSKGMRQK